MAGVWAPPEPEPYDEDEPDPVAQLDSQEPEPEELRDSSWTIPCVVGGVPCPKPGCIC